MCTVSIVPTGQGFRVVCNRDERLTRPPATAPRAWPTEVSWATYPGDPASGGTWIGVNDDGLVAVLLNRTVSPVPARTPSSSRGIIVPPLLDCRSIALALNVAAGLDHDAFEPFRIVLVQRSLVAVYTSEHTNRRQELFPLAGPAMWTSSSLGDAIVEGPRRALFDSLVASGDDWLHGQFQFHRHRWIGQPDISVHMERHDAATVSRTTIDVTRLTIDVEYESPAGAGLALSAVA
jgi:hypothetical protein